MTAAELYAAMCDYLTANGWKRLNPGGVLWWHKNLFANGRIEEAVEWQLAEDGVDLSEEPGANKPEAARK